MTAAEPSPMCLTCTSDPALVPAAVAEDLGLVLREQAGDRFLERIPTLTHLPVVEEAHAFVVAGAVQNCLPGGCPDAGLAADSVAQRALSTADADAPG